VVHETSPVRRGRILIVDDEGRNRELLRELLESCGHEVAECADGRTALERIRTGEGHDAILLDIMMPGLDGFEVCRQLKADDRTARIPVLMITVLAAPEDRRNAIACGALDFITKPIDPQEVALRVANAIQAKHLFDDLLESHTRLRRLEELRDALTSMTIHDLSSPLAGVIASLDLVQRTPRESRGEDAEEMLQDALHSARRLQLQIRCLLDINRIESQAMPLAMVACDLAHHTREAVASLALRGTAPVRIVSDPAVLVARCDPLVIERVIANLVANAVRFTPVSGSVTVKLEERGDRAVVTVEDTGAGILPEHLPRVFDRYFHAESGRKRVGATGLGLAFCRLAVEAHGGIIGVESEAGQGSRFCFQLARA
jgi:signal transduction histidine kinase